jgi:hypothetical protein
MYTQSEKSKNNISRAVANAVSQKKSGDEPAFQFVDNRAEAIAQRKLKELTNNYIDKQHVVSLRKPIQRKISFTDGPRDKSRNLADTFLKFYDYGTTPVNINGETFPGGNADEAINPPVLSVMNENSIYKLNVTGPPTNDIGYSMVLPTDPPWLGRAPISKINVCLRLQDFSIDSSMYDDESSEANVSIKGLPNDERFAGLVEEHEDYHVRDLTKIIREVLMPWDEKITELASEKTTLTGASAEEVKEKLYTHLGGDAKTIGNLIVNELRKRGGAFHKTEEGKSPTIDSTTFSRISNFLNVYLKHPMS